MSARAERLDAVLAVVKDNDVAYEVKRLRDIEAWVRAQLPLAAGDRAVLRKSAPLVIARASGWWHWRECLRPGATGRVTGVSLGPRGWYAEFVPDAQWSVSEWKPGDERRYGVGDRPGTFCVNLRHLRKRRKGDKGLAMPDDVVQPKRF